MNENIITKIKVEYKDEGDQWVEYGTLDTNQEYSDDLQDFRTVQITTPFTTSTARITVVEY